MDLGKNLHLFKDTILRGDLLKSLRISHNLERCSIHSQEHNLQTNVPLAIWIQQTQWRSSITYRTPQTKSTFSHHNFRHSWPGEQPLLLKKCMYYRDYFPFSNTKKTTLNTCPATARGYLSSQEQHIYGIRPSLISVEATRTEAPFPSKRISTTKTLRGYTRIEMLPQSHYLNLLTSIMWVIKQIIRLSVYIFYLFPL